MKIKTLAIPMMMTVLASGCSSNIVEETQEQNPVDANIDPVVTETPPVVMDVDPLPTDTEDNLENYLTNKEWRIEAATRGVNTLMHEAGMKEMLVMFRTDPDASQWANYGRQGEGYVDQNFSCVPRYWSMEGETLYVIERGDIDANEQYIGGCEDPNGRDDVRNDSEFNMLAASTWVQIASHITDVFGEGWDKATAVTYYEATGQLLLESTHNSSGDKLTLVPVQ